LRHIPNPFFERRLIGPSCNLSLPPLTIYLIPPLPHRIQRTWLSHRTLHDNRTWVPPALSHAHLSPDTDSPFLSARQAAFLSEISDMPTLATLVARNLTGADFSNESLLAIIIKAQPHHSRRSLGHLSRSQLIEHVDALIAWWKAANPRRASVISQMATATTAEERGSIRSRGSTSSRRDDCCCVVFWYFGDVGKGGVRGICLCKDGVRDLDGGRNRSLRGRILGVVNLTLVYRLCEWVIFSHCRVCEAVVVLQSIIGTSLPNPDSSSKASDTKHNSTPRILYVAQCYKCQN